MYRKIIAPGSKCLVELCDAFGYGILLADGYLNRKALARIVFESDNRDENQKKINSITHKYILDKTREILCENEALGVVATIVDAPLLFESGFSSECDLIISVIAEKEQKIARLKSRDGLSPEQAEARLACQTSDEFLISNSDIIIYNSGSVEELDLKVGEIAKKIFLMR